VEGIATYVDRDILQGAWLLGEQVIAKKAAAVTAKHNAGKVVLVGFRPQHRDQTHGTFKLVFNALLDAPAPQPGTPTTSQQSSRPQTCTFQARNVSSGKAHGGQRTSARHAVTQVADVARSDRNGCFRAHRERILIRARSVDGWH
jgi:hypothetical protein